MAGIGSAWGSREEMLHPRDRHGRFRKKWKMAQGVVDALSSFLDRFQPRQFQSDQQASQYAFNNRKTPWTSTELQRLHTDWDDANEALQAGEMDDTTKKFVAMMDRNMVETTDDLIMSQTVPTTAFGLTPQQAALEEGGLEDLIGLEIGDAGYGAFNLGSELSHPPGSVTIRVAVPKGTRVAFGGRSPNDRSVIADRDQPLVVTKVESDGRGGWYMLAIAGSGRKTQGATAVADDRTHGRRGGGLTPEQREARVTPQMSGEERLRIAQQNEREMQGGVVPAPSATSTQAPAPAAPAASPQAPAPPASGVPERQEPVLKDAVGPGSPEGKSASDIATEAEAAKVQAENAPPAPAPATPASFNDAIQASDLKAPSRGKRQKEFNDAAGGIVAGKTTPQDALRQLDTDIEVNKRALERQKAGTEKPDPELEQDIKDQEALADLISSHHGVPRRGQKAGPTPTPGAPSTKREATPKAPAPKKPAKRAPVDVAEQMKSVQTRDEGNALLEGLTAPELHAVAEAAGIPVPKRATKDKLKQTIGQFGFGKRLDSDAISGQGARRRAEEAGKLTPDQERRVVARAKSLPDVPRNEEEERIKRQAAEIEARDTGAPPAPVPKAAPSEATQARTVAKRAPAKAAPVPEAPVAPVKKVTPAKAAPSPVGAEEEAFKARVAEAGLPDKVADLRAQAREQKIRGFSTMNKRQLQSALLGDEVPKATKIGVAAPAKMVPHLKAAKSDQEARKLLENHTLADLRAMAKSDEVGVKLPARGVTKDKAKDAILETIRGGPETGQGETPARSLRQELDAQKWVEPSNPETADKVRGMISDTDEMDAEDLRNTRDALEELSGQRRRAGDRQDANLIQTLADTMGMRAQTISGVEEGPARAPVKRVAKKAVPEVTAPEAPKSLDKMLKNELAQVAADEKVPGIRKSMTKPQLKEAIEQHRRVESARAEGAPNLGGQRDRAPTPEEIQQDTVRAKKLVPKGSVAGPKADVPIKTSERQRSFLGAWESQDLTSAKMMESTGAAGRSLAEVRDDITNGRITPEEGIRRIESDIAFNKEDLADLDAEMRQLRGSGAPGRAEVAKQQRQLRAGIAAQEKASSFIREHFRDEAPVTREELEIQLDGPEKAALDRVDVDSLKQAARQEGLGEIDGDDKDTVIKNIGKAIAKRELANRDKERKANERQAQIDRVRNHADAIAGIEEVLDGGTDRAVAARVRSQSTASKLSPELRQDLVDNAGDRDALRGILDRVRGENGLRRIDARGQKTHFDPERHDLPPGSGIKKGDPVTVLQPGFRADVVGEDMQIRRAKVTEGHGGVPEAPAPKKAAKFLPPLKDGTQRKSMTNVEVGDVVQRAGARQGPPGRVTRIERGKTSAGNPDLIIHLEDGRTISGAPQSAVWMGKEDDTASGIRRLAEGGFNEPLIEGAPPRKATSAPKKTGFEQTRNLTTLASTPTQEAPRTPEYGEEVDDAVRRAISESKSGTDFVPLDLVRQRLGDRYPREDVDNALLRLNRSKDVVLAPQSNQKVLEEADWRAGISIGNSVKHDVRLEAPGRAKLATKKAAPPKVVDLKNPTRHDAELIGTGLDLDAKGEDRQWLDVVQRSLDRGEDGRQIADGLRREADSERTIHNIQEAIEPGTSGPAGRIDRMERMADRLEGVRPLEKPVAEVKAPEGRKEMGTMQAAQAQSRAFSDLKAGKSHAEVATALRQAATSVGSREHDPQMVRPIEFTPSERSALKRGDAKKLRELAAEIQAQGVAQRAAAKAAKKAATPSRASANALAREQRKRDVEARSDLTGPIGEVIANQLNHTVEQVTSASSDEEAMRAISGLLMPELRQLADRVGVSRSVSLGTPGISGRVSSKDVLRQRIIARLRGTEAPTTSAERAVPKAEAPGAGAVDESVPMQPYSKTDNMRMHVDSPTMDLVKRYEAAGRNGSANRMLDLRRRATEKGGSTTPQQVVDELKAIRAQETDPKFQRELDHAIEANDAPMTSMPDLPPDTPPAARELVERLHAIPYARKGRGEPAAIGTTGRDSLEQQVAEVLREIANGTSRQQPEMRLRSILTQQVHEMNEPSFRIWELAQFLEPVTDAQGRRRPSPLTLALREMRPK